MNGYIPKYEVFIVFSVYLAGLLFAFQKTYLISDVNLKEYNLLAKGWMLNRKRDDYDYEWEINKNFILQHIYLYLFYALLMEVVRILKIEQISAVLAFFGCCSITYLYGLKILIILVIQTFIYYCISHHHKGSKLYIWVYSFIWIAILNLAKQFYFYDKLNLQLQLSNNQLFECASIISWNIIKCISFTIDKIESKKKNYSEQKQFYSMTDLFGYSFYIPTMVFGPIIIYKKFSDMLAQPDATDFFIRLRGLIKGIIKCGFWAIILEFTQHVFYVNLIQTEYQLLNEINMWALFGLGYLMGQTFHLKYFVFYGFATAFGQFDGIDMPKLPICVGHIHLYSEMWKKFDEGLYQFLLKYIYTQLCVKKPTTVSRQIQRVLASSITFLFIFIWHGLYMFILIWSMLNWICICLEQGLKAFTKSKFFQRWTIGVSTTTKERIIAAIGSNIFIMSVISNFFFFAREETGYIYIKRTYFESFTNYFGVLVFAYCYYRSSDWIRLKYDQK